jgi:5S rRNA maturation endonuclease (ribonuclease M5)
MDKQDFRERKRLESIVERLDRDLDAVIVEGYSDRLIIEKLGFTGKIFESAERSIEDLVEDVERGANTVGILTDFDSHGKEENRKIRHALQDKVDVINTARDEFGSQLTSTGRMAVEDVRPLFVSKQQKFVDATLDEIYFRDWNLD